MSKRKLQSQNDNDIDIDVEITDLTEPPSKKQRLITSTDTKFKPLPFTIDYFAASDKGKKPHMEDRHFTIADLSSKFSHPFTTTNNCRLFCIIDGHGGSTVASYCQTHLAEIFMDNLEKYVINGTVSGSNNIQKALHATFKIFDGQILKMMGSIKNEGCTCTLVYFQNEMVYTANVGDSKAVLGRICESDGMECDTFEEEKIQSLLVSTEHSVLQLSEAKRIESCKGQVLNGRVNGILEITRSFGDFEMKKFGVSAVPSVSKFRVCQRDRFMIIACDGLWSVFSVSDATEFVNAKFNHMSKPSVEEVTRQLLADAVLNRQAKDNVSAIIVRFNH